MQIVNGYVCQNCTDVEYAKKLVDPAHPKPGQGDVKDLSKSQENTLAEAVSFGGTLAKLNQPRREDDPAKVSFEAAHAPGARIDVSA